MTRKSGTSILSQLRVGIFVLFGLLILAFLILNSTGDFNPFEKKITLKARFSAADGLREGSEVQLAGVRVGKVTQVVLLSPDSPPEEKIEATMSVDASINKQPVSERIRTDSTAQLVAVSVLANDKIINITPGTDKGNPVAENHILPSRGAISINQLTQTGNDLLHQINQIAIPANEILQKANKGEGTLGRIVNDEALYNNLDQTIAEARLTMLKLQNSIDKINTGEGTAGQLLTNKELYNNINSTVVNLETISANLRDGRGTAGKIFTDDALYNETRNTLARVNSIADDLKSITEGINSGEGTLGKLVKDEKLYNNAQDTLVKFNSTAERLEKLLADAQAGKGTIGRLVTDETLYLNINRTASNINQLSSEGTKLIYDFRQNPRKYLRIRVSIF